MILIMEYDLASIAIGIFTLAFFFVPVAYFNYLNKKMKK